MCVCVFVLYNLLFIFFPTESGALEEDYPIETVESAWVCDVCDELTGQGFEDLITHLSSQEHAHKVIKHPSPLFFESNNQLVSLSHLL